VLHLISCNAFASIVQIDLQPLFSLDRSRLLQPFTYNYEIREIDRNHLIVPEIMVENLHSDLAETMKPLFDAI
jgi:hypothetical protein